jgi:flavodoxin
MEERKIVFTRREGLKSALLLGISVNLALSADRARAQQASSNGTVLVAYYTRTGNTQVIARQIRRALDADLFQIQTTKPYPEDYKETVAQATREREIGFEPSLAELVPDFERYETVFLGFPIWGMSAPPVIRSFLSRHDLSGKALVPFITHDGYGRGNSLDVVTLHAPQAQLVEGFSLEADQERRTLEQVTSWLGDLRSRGGASP